MKSTVSKFLLGIIAILSFLFINYSNSQSHIWQCNNYTTSTHILFEWLFSTKTWLLNIPFLLTWACQNFSYPGLLETIAFNSAIPLPSSINLCFHCLTIASWRFSPSRQSSSANLRTTATFYKNTSPTEHFSHPQFIFNTNHQLLHHLLHATSLMPLQLFGINSLQTLKLQLLLAPLNLKLKLNFFRCLAHLGWFSAIGVLLIHILGVTTAL